MTARATRRIPWLRPPALVGGAILVMMTVGALLAPVLFPEGPWPSVGTPYTPPFENLALPFGTDTLGRNVAAGLFYGARVSLTIAVAATVVALSIGILVGATAGYAQGWVDDVLMRVTEIFQTIPNFIFVIVLVVILRPSIAAIIGAIAIVSWPPIARLVRAEFMSLRSREFVLSCRLVGVPPLKIVFTEMLPNCLSPVIVASSIMVATAVLLEAGLSFLGLGDPNVISWGTMVAIGRPALRTAPYLSIFPGMAIFLSVIAINFVGETLNEVLDPRRSHR
ncbi:MAG: transporter permease [Tardiphaga sp.]|jgi:peptide/nickel transport system permease protein|nr:transporter permease [Tardiphaga sp.]